jgi:hypothetical protein
MLTFKKEKIKKREMVSNTVFTLSSTFVAVMSSVVTFLTMGNPENSTIPELPVLELPPVLLPVLELPPVHSCNNYSEITEQLQQNVVQSIICQPDSSLTLTFTNANLIILIMNFILIVLVVANTVAHCSRSPITQ